MGNFLYSFSFISIFSIFPAILRNIPELVCCNCDRSEKTGWLQTFISCRGSYCSWTQVICHRDIYPGYFSCVSEEDLHIIAYADIYYRDYNTQHIFFQLLQQLKCLHCEDKEITISSKLSYSFGASELLESIGRNNSW